jgi:hypothetical protein
MMNDMVKPTMTIHSTSAEYGSIMMNVWQFFTQ